MQKLLLSFAGMILLSFYWNNTPAQSFASATTTEKIAGNYHQHYFIIDNTSDDDHRETDVFSPTLSSTNPSSCFGTTGSITIGNLIPGASYDVSYTDDGVPVGPANHVADGSGQIILTGLNAGFYASFSLVNSGVTVNLFTGIILSDPIFVPTFVSIAPFCAGSTAPVLPASSINGLNGTWSPAVVNNQSSGNYTFTPTGGQCAVATTITVTVIPKAIPSFNFGTSTTICAGATVPSLPNTSTNSITGTWNPAIVDNQNSGVYTFTPTAGLCAAPTSFTVTVTPNTTPTFNIGSGLTICAGATIPSLPLTSTNGVNGTWSPSVINNQNSGTYTFTPDAGQCATITTFNVIVNPNNTPIFNSSLSAAICAGETVPVLPTTSANGITGTWSPAVINNQSSGNYVFTPTAGVCALPFILGITVNPNIVPSFPFGNSTTICAGATVPALTAVSSNGITGTWTPAIIDNQNSGVYTFTADAGQCATTKTFTVTVTPNITPTFNFGNSITICAGAGVPALSSTSSNGVTGTWSPSIISNQASNTYTFTATAGVCALPFTFTVTVNPNIAPVFSFGSSTTICAGGSLPTLPNTSDNGIPGTWSPSTTDNQHSGVYTFTPDAGLCSMPFSFTVTVNPNITPVFSFGSSTTICAGAVVPILPASSTNGITGTWSPLIIDNQHTGIYTFTPDAGLCAISTSFTVTVNPNITPVFSFGSSVTICEGGAVQVLPAVSTNGVTGVWSPAIVDNQHSGVYTFTTNSGQCVTTTTITFTVTVTPNIIPVFSVGHSLTICAGAAVPVLPVLSDNGITGTWTPSIVSNQTSGTYVFTTAAGQCVTPYTFTVTVNPIIVASFDFGIFQSTCIGSAVPALTLLSANGITGTWSPSVVDNLANGTYNFTPAAGQCASGTTFTLEVNPVPSVNAATDTTVYDGAVLPAYNFIATPGAVVTWMNSNPDIGLPKTGSGAVPSFIAINHGNDTVIAIIKVTPAINGCAGIQQQYKIKILPLNKDVFVPNVFSPNHDGKNDALLVYGNYIDKIDMHVFNQWGQQIAVINNRAQGWDGTYKGTAQPVGVYVYVLRVVLTNGKTIDKKGSITLVR